MIEWVEPPNAKRGKASTKWGAITTQLKDNPNTWAKIGTVKHASQGTVISKQYSVKVVSRKNLDGTYDLYGMSEE